MKHRIRSVISALAVLVYASVGVVAVHAEVLCVGVDGHVAFDGPAGSDDCHGESSHGSLATLGGDESRCTDFALPGRTALKAADNRDALANQSIIVVWVLFENFPSEPTFPVRAPAFDGRADSARTLTSHQTAILLI